MQIADCCKKALDDSIDLTRFVFLQLKQSRQVGISCKICRGTLKIPKIGSSLKVHFELKTTFALFRSYVAINALNHLTLHYKSVKAN